VSTVMVNNLRRLSHTASLRADRKAVPNRSRLCFVPCLPRAYRDS
jgi:hypothetical protein